INALKTDAGNNATAASATLTVTSSSGTPVATVSSTALTDSLQVGASDSQTLTIGNTGTADLTFNIAEAAPQQIVLGLHSKNAQLAAKQLHAADAKLSMMPIAVGTTQVLPANVAQPLGSLSFAHDDGSAETSIVWSDQAQTIEYAAIYLNRFTPPAGTGAFTINTVSVEWPNQGTASSNTLVGQQARIVAYYDADGDGDPSNATYLGQSSVTIASEDAFETYNVSFDVAGAGDIYVGFEDAWAEAGYTPLLAPGGLDTTSSAGDSFLYGMNDNNAPDLQNLANNTFGKTIDTAGFAGNWLIRATGTTLGGPSATCANPTSVPWLSVSPVSGSVTAAGSIAVTVGFDATGMVVGNYTALLCIATNDPNQASIEVPVSMDVTACAAAPADRLFADGFELASSGCDGGNANLVTGTINQAVTNTINGSAFNFVTGTYVADNGGTTDDDINLWSSGGTLEIFWPDTNHTSIGCQADANGHCKVLQSGATVGTPGQTFAGVTDELTLWLAGVDGYLGVAFWNESTSELDYGYIHMTTTASSGFPAQWLEYGYDASGAPVTIP
ncbi:MAG: hypothetical protein L0H70_07325, partial [Xanthomonadales bacterium]|nr:hypothetical protein [Xanthomonadales bacterium]